MEDEEGYMVYNRKPRKELGKPSQLSPMQVEAPEATLKMEETSALDPFQSGLQPGHGVEMALIALKDSLQRKLDLGTSPCPRWQWIGLLIAWAANIFLAITVTVLAFQMAQQTNGTEDKTYLATVLHLKHFLCKPLDNHATGNCRCRLCPQNWYLHGNKCYWISEENRTWHESEKDCRVKLSHMLVIENQDEVAFIQSIVEGAHLLWIGLTATLPERKWTWVDGSPLDDNILQVISPVEANSCGQLNENQIVSEACSAAARWICKTDSLLI